MPDSEQLTMVVITGSNWSRQSTTSWVGIGSNLHDFLVDFFMIALVSRSVNNSNDRKTFAHAFHIRIWWYFVQI